MRIFLFLLAFFFSTLSIYSYETLFYEDCEDISDWTIINGSNHSIPTSFSNENPCNYDLSGYDEKVISTDVASYSNSGVHVFDAKIQSPSIDCSQFNTIKLSYKNTYAHGTVNPYDYCIVYVHSATYNDSTLYIFYNDDDFEWTTTLDLSEFLVYDDQIQIQFEYRNTIEPGENGYWLFDDITVTGYNQEEHAHTCLHLDGSNDYAQVNDCVIPSSGDFTVAVWAKANEIQTGYREILSQNAGAGEDFYIGLASNGNIRAGDDWLDTGTTFPLDNLWHYFTVVKNDTNTYLYLDGKLEATKASAITNPAGTEFRIGRQYGEHAEYFKGEVEEIRIWDKELSVTEIRESMHLVQPLNDPNLVSYYQFNFEETNQIFDSVSSTIGTTYGAVKVESDLEIGTGNVYSIDVNSTGVYPFTDVSLDMEITSITGNTSFTATKLNKAPNLLPWSNGAFTDQFWIVHDFGDEDFLANLTFYPIEQIDPFYEEYPEYLFVGRRSVPSPYSGYGIFEANDVNSSSNYATFNLYNSMGQFVLTQEMPPELLSTVPANETLVSPFTEISATFDYDMLGWGGDIIIHRMSDGSIFEQFDSSDLTYDGDTVSIIPTNPLEYDKEYFITIQSDALWGYNEVPYGGINDNTTWNFMTLPFDAAAGTCLDFDGSDEYINLGSDDQITGANPRTIELWAYTESFNNGGLFQAGIIGTTGADFSLRTLTTDNCWRAQFWGSTDFDVTLPDSKNEWHHYCLTYDGSTNRLYYDGELVGYEDSNLNTGTQEIYVGRWNVSYFNGKIDELRIWNVARTEEQIRESMHLSVDSTEPGLLQYHKFNTGFGEIEYSIQGDTGTLLNMEEEDWQPNEIPIGYGSSFSHSITLTDLYDFTNTGVSILVNSLSEPANFTVTKLDHAPNIQPDISDVFDGQYWIIKQFGTATIETNLTFEPSETIVTEDENNPQNLVVCKREDNSALNWNLFKSAEMVDQLENSVTFSDFNNYSQVILGHYYNPFVTDIFPKDDSPITQLDTDLVITFSKDVQAETGNIYIKRLADNTIYETIPAANCSINSNLVTIDPTANLLLNTEYYIEIENNAFQDGEGNFYDGIDDNSTWNFSTGDFYIVNLTPTDDENFVLTDANLEIEFNRPISLGTGNIVIKYLDDDSIFESIPVVNCSINNTVVTIDPTTDFAFDTDYYINYDGTTFHDGTENYFPELADKTSWDFSSTPVPGTVYSGIISSNTLWDTENIVVAGDITVPAGITLSINSGTDVIFYGDFQINVQGRILAQGTHNDSIRFYPDDLALGWDGIRFFSNSTPDSSKFEYCVFEYAIRNDMGGAIYVNNFNRVLINYCSFKNNEAGEGGAIYGYNSNMTITNNDFYSNKAIYYNYQAAGYGGAIRFDWFSNLTIFGNTFTDNFATYQGGAIRLGYECVSTIQNNIFTENSSAWLGGAVNTDNSTVLFSNNLLDGNHADAEAGAIFWDGYGLIINCTFVNNTAGNTGGAVFFQGYSEIKNSIFWNNSPNHILKNNGDYWAMGEIWPTTYNGLSYSCVENGGYTGTGNITDNPQFAGIEDHSFSIVENSLCIDAGDVATNSNDLPEFDLSGNPRFENIIDIGAYEYCSLVAPDSPANLIIQVIGNDIQISWDKVSEANSYKIFACDTPNGEFIDVTDQGIFYRSSLILNKKSKRQVSSNTNSFIERKKCKSTHTWTTPIDGSLKFFYVKASTD